MHDGPLRITTFAEGDALECGRYRSRVSQRSRPLKMPLLCAKLMSDMSQNVTLEIEMLLTLGRHTDNKTERGMIRLADYRPELE